VGNHLWDNEDVEVAANIDRVDVRRVEITQSHNREDGEKDETSHYYECQKPQRDPIPHSGSKLTNLQLATLSDQIQARLDLNLLKSK